MRLRTLFAGLSLVALAAFGQEAVITGSPAGSFDPAPIGQFQPYTTPTSLPLWIYSVQAAQDGNVYGGFIVGSNPTLLWKNTVPVIVVPVIVNYNAGSYVWTFDPTQPDSGCLAAGTTGYGQFFDSPVFEQNTWNMNGFVASGTQWLDAEIRSEFVNAAGFAGTFSQRLSLAANEFPPLVVNIVPGDIPMGAPAMSQSHKCGNAVSYTTAVNPGNAIGFLPASFNAGNNGGIGTLNGLFARYIGQHEILPSQLTVFVAYKTIGLDRNGNGICHSHDDLSNNGANPYANPVYTTVFAHYGVNDGAGCESDVAPAARALANWAHDPFPRMSQNLTPYWGGVYGHQACADTYEPGNAIRGLHPLLTYGSPQITYTLPEVAYFDWFYGGNSNIAGGYTSLYGAGGLYSDDGTYTGPAIVCGTDGGQLLTTSGGGIAGEGLLIDPSFEPPPTALPGAGSGFVNETTGVTFGGPGNDSAWTVIGPAGADVSVYASSETAPIPGYPGPVAGWWYVNVIDGTQALDLTCSADLGLPMGVEQTVTTTPGATYTLTFYVGAVYTYTISMKFYVWDVINSQYLACSNGEAYSPSLTGPITVSGGVYTVTATNNGPAPGSAGNPYGGNYGGTGWGQIACDVTAGSASTALVFVNNNVAAASGGPYLSGLDDVQFTARQ